MGREVEPLYDRKWLSSQSMWAIIRILVYRYLLPLIFTRTFFFNLSILSFFEKRTKNFGTREKSSQAPFAHAAECEPSVGHLLATPGFRLFSGCCGTCFVRLYKKIYTRTKLQTVLTQWPENSRPCVGFFNGAVSPSATDYLLARIAYSKTTAAPHNFSSAQW